jgi:hypothetical protein
MQLFAIICNIAKRLAYKALASTYIENIKLNCVFDNSLLYIFLIVVIAI